MNLTITQAIGLVKELLAIYKPLVGKNLSTAQALAVGEQVVAVLVKYNVTLQDLQAVLEEVQPLVALFA